MKSQLKVLIVFMFFIFCVFNSSYGEEKLIRYFSGSLTKGNEKIQKNFSFKGKTNYQIKLCFVNYSDSTRILQYRLNSDNFKEINIDSLNSRNEVFEINPQISGNLQIEIKADIPDPVSSFISYDILILKDE